MAMQLLGGSPNPDRPLQIRMRPGLILFSPFVTVPEKKSAPVWPGHPMTAHWGIADPAAVQGTEREKRAAFALAYEALSHRIGLFLDLPLAATEKAALRRQLNEIGHVNDDDVRFNVNPSNTTTSYEYER